MKRFDVSSLFIFATLRTKLLDKPFIINDTSIDYLDTTLKSINTIIDETRYLSYCTLIVFYHQIITIIIYIKCG